MKLTEIEGLCRLCYKKHEKELIDWLEAHAINDVTINTVLDNDRAVMFRKDSKSDGSSLPQKTVGICFF